MLRSGKTPYLRFDRNDYSIPPTLIQKPLTLYADLAQVRIFDGDNRVTEHRCSFSQGEQIEHSAHIEALVAYKAQAKQQQWLSANSVACVPPNLGASNRWPNSIGTGHSTLSS